MRNFVDLKLFLLFAVLSFHLIFRVFWPLVSGIGRFALEAHAVVCGIQVA